jgi:diguanylate cyclase (GGDEF)-like protein/PAS domain S-box-containing protein
MTTASIGTERFAAADASTDSKDHVVRSILNASPDAAIVIDKEGRICGWNAQAEHHFGWGSAEIVGRNFVEAVVPKHLQGDRPDDVFRVMRTNARAGTGSKVQITASHRDGASLPVEIYFSDIDGYSDQACVAFLRDISERRHSELERRLAAIAFETTDGVVVTDAELNTLKVNNAFTRITGYSKREAVGRRAPMLSDLHDHLLRHRSWNDEIVGWRKSGEAYPARLRVKAVFDEEERVTHYVASFNDLSSKKALQKRVNQLTSVDQLTGLPNRSAMFKTLSNLRAVDRACSHSALVLIDLDHFKSINDRLGYSAGDLLLQQVAHRLKTLFRRSMVLSRFGGDAFLLLLEGIGADGDQALTHARGVADQVQQCLVTPFESQACVSRLTSSIGISIFCGADTPTEALVSRVEAAMYEAKQAGGRCIRVYPLA